MTHTFRIWAPEKERMILHLLTPVNELLEMRREEDTEGHRGYFSLTVPGAGAGSRYRYLLDDGKEYPDPASHFQPEGVHGPSEIVTHEYAWKTEPWAPRPFSEWVLYELHVGTFTPEGTFDAVIPRLDALRALGINALELMPVAQFPGSRNWGYDATFPYAVQNSYGGPGGLKRLVDACHARDIAVVLDVVYNHLGPEGNYAANFAPYFTNEYHTPWGGALNLDGPWSDGARDFIIGNMRHWFEHYRIDALRVDAIHAMYDKSALHLWQQARIGVEQWKKDFGRPLLLIAESDLNDPRVVSPREFGGFEFDAQWLDDFHHALYVLVHREGRKHYEDFGKLDQLAKAYTEGFVHSGEYVGFRKRRHGVSSAHIAPEQFVVFNQNHDQAGNRALGERLSQLVDARRLKVAAAAMILSPYIPLLFMGEEYGDPSPFQFFADYGDPEVCEGMREGRKREFERFDWGASPPDPMDPETFNRSRLQWESRETGEHAELLRWHRDLIALRARPAFRQTARASLSAEVMGDQGLMLRRRALAGEAQGVRGEEAACLFNFSDEPLTILLPPGGGWRRVLDSSPADGGAALTGEPLRAGHVILEAWSALVLTREGTP